MINRIRYKQKNGRNVTSTMNYPHHLDPFRNFTVENDVTASFECADSFAKLWMRLAHPWCGKGQLELFIKGAEKSFRHSGVISGDVEINLLVISPGIRRIDNTAPHYFLC
jgi:hypothetical protein